MRQEGCQVGANGCELAATQQAASKQTVRIAYMHSRMHTCTQDCTHALKTAQMHSNCCSTPTSTL